MVKHVWSVLCTKAVIDSDSNNINLIDVLESLQVDIKPHKEKLPPAMKAINLPVRYELVNLWLNEGGREQAIQLSIELNDPEGKQLHSYQRELVLPADKLRMRSITKIHGISLTTNGIYNFIVGYKQKKDDQFTTAAEIPLEVIITKGN